MLQRWIYFGKHANKKDIISSKLLKKEKLHDKTADFLVLDFCNPFIRIKDFPPLCRISEAGVNMFRSQII